MTALLNAQQVAKTFPYGDGQLSVLECIDLALHPGQSVSICGESGCGKSTLLNILAGLESADRGKIFWEGCPIDLKPKAVLAAERARFIGMIFQSYHLVAELNVLENVLLPHRILGRVGSAQRKRASKLLDQVGLKERQVSSPSHLSGGERQRVAVARALMNAPPLLLADEPTGNLDPRTGQGVMDVLLTICREEQTALILVTHHKSFALYTDQQYFLQAGTLQRTA